MNPRKKVKIEPEENFESAFADAKEFALDGDNEKYDTEYEEWMGREDH